MRFNVVTFGSAFVDVYLSSPEFKIVKSKDSPTGVAICEVYGAKIEKNFEKKESALCMFRLMTRPQPATQPCW